MKLAEILKAVNEKDINTVYSNLDKLVLKDTNGDTPLHHAFRLDNLIEACDYSGRKYANHQFLETLSIRIMQNSRHDESMRPLFFQPNNKGVTPVHQLIDFFVYVYKKYTK